MYNFMINTMTEVRDPLFHKGLSNVLSDSKFDHNKGKCIEVGVCPSYFNHNLYTLFFFTKKGQPKKTIQ